MMMERIGDFMQLCSGEPFWPLDPREDEIHIEDIAHSLARQNRYGGHIVPENYCVAEHSWHISYTVPNEYALSALLHDAPESILQDVIRPIKGELKDYRPIEINLEKIIFKKYGVPFPIPDIVMEHDRRICVDERDQVMAKPKKMWLEGVEPLGVELQCWSPNIAKQMFLMRFHELYNG